MRIDLINSVTPMLAITASHKVAVPPTSKPKTMIFTFIAKIMFC